MTSKLQPPWPFDPILIDRLREMFHEGKTIATMVHYLKATLPPLYASNFIMVVKYFRLAFPLTFSESRTIEGAQCMGNAAYSDEELESILRPLILERLSGSPEPNPSDAPRGPIYYDFKSDSSSPGHNAFETPRVDPYKDFKMFRYPVLFVTPKIEDD